MSVLVCAVVVLLACVTVCIARPLCAFADDVPGDALAYSEDESGNKTYYNT